MNLAAIVNKALPDRTASMQGTVDTSRVRRTSLIAMLRLPDKSGDKLDVELHAALREAYASMCVELIHDFMGDGVNSRLFVMQAGGKMEVSALTLDPRIIIIIRVEVVDGVAKYHVHHNGGQWLGMTLTELKALEDSIPGSKVFNLNAVLRIVADQMPDTAARAAVEVYLNQQVEV